MKLGDEDDSDANVIDGGNVSLAKSVNENESVEHSIEGKISRC